MKLNGKHLTFDEKVAWYKKQAGFKDDPKFVDLEMADITPPIIHDPNKPPTVVSYKDYGDVETIEVKELEVSGAPFLTEEQRNELSIYNKVNEDNRRL